MAIPTRIITGTLIVLLVMAVGFGIGVFVAKLPPASPEDKATSPQNAEPNFNTYDVSPPSRAVTLATQDIKIEHTGDNAFAVLKKEDATNIKTGQRVFLYDTNDKLIEALAVVRAIDLIEESKGKITILLRPHDDAVINMSTAVRGRVIVRQIPDSPRLPLSALVKDDGGETYVWQTSQNEDGTTSVWYKRVNVVTATPDFFVIEETMGDRGDYVLNPDDNLQDGQTINVATKLYAGPLQSEDSRIVSLMQNRKRIYQAQRARELAEKYGGTKGGGCAVKPNAAKDFLAKVKKYAPLVRQESRPVQ